MKLATSIFGLFILGAVSLQAKPPLVQERPPVVEPSFDSYLPVQEDPLAPAGELQPKDGSNSGEPSIITDCEDCKDKVRAEVPSRQAMLDSCIAWRVEGFEDLSLEECEAMSSKDHFDAVVDALKKCMQKRGYPSSDAVECLASSTGGNAFR